VIQELVEEMSDFDEKELSKLMKLCRVHCSEEEKRKLLANLKKILVHFTHLQEIDTEGVEPCNHVFGTMQNVMRQDITGDVLSREKFLANAPSHVGGMIKVPPVIKFTEP
jgi:aspartyl-tRNA(Asn)/glutamyl-tRNA(Gln) amidotransferase subunit C